MNRNGRPSMRAKPLIEWVAPVQCFGQSWVSLSAVDHTQKYGSCVTSGTAGGRSGGGDGSAALASAKGKAAAARTAAINRRTVGVDRFMALSVTRKKLRPHGTRRPHAAGTSRPRRRPVNHPAPPRDAH